MHGAVINNRQKMSAKTFPADFDVINAELYRLSRLSLPELRDAWINCLGSAPPAIQSRKIVMRMLAWQIQERAFGGLDSAIRRKLSNIIKTIEREGEYEPKVRRNLAPGTNLTREWKGVMYKAVVTSDGFTLFDKKYKSLSELARSITGTRWSGPRFFGLEKRKISRRPQGDS